MYRRYTYSPIHLLLAVLVILLLFNAFGRSTINISDMVLFYIAGRAVTLFNVIAFASMIWLLKYLVSPFREILMLLLLLWLLSIFGFFFFAGFGNILMIIIVLVIVFSLLGIF